MRNLIRRHKIFFGAILLLMLLTIPLTVWQAQQQQEIRQRAAPVDKADIGIRLCASGSVIDNIQTCNSKVEGAIDWAVKIVAVNNSTESVDLSAFDLELSYYASYIKSLVFDQRTDYKYNIILNKNTISTNNLGRDSRIKIAGVNNTSSPRIIAPNEVIMLAAIHVEPVASINETGLDIANATRITVNGVKLNTHKHLARQANAAYDFTMTIAPAVAQVTVAPTATPIPTSTVRLDNIVPSSGNTESNITLTGNGFGTSRGFVIFLTPLNSQNGAPIVSWTNQQIVATVPGLLTSNQTDQVFVRTSNNIESNKLTYQILQGQPQVDSITPLGVPPGGQLIVNGEGMGSSQGKILFYKTSTLSETGQIITWADNLVRLTIPSNLTPNTEYGIQVETAGNTHSSLKFYTLGTATVATATPVPTNTPTPTPTPTPIPVGTTSLALKIALFEIVDNPKRENRKLKIEILDPLDNNKKIADLTDKNISNDKSTKQFKGTHALDTNFKSGIYNIKVKTDGYLRRLIPAAQITKGTQNNIALATLTPGDINNDNTVNILDYTLLRDCFGNKANTPTCTNKLNSDLNDDGIVDGVDYNAFIKGLSVKEGD